MLQDKKIISLSVRKAAWQFIDDVPSSECAAPHGPHYFQKAALDFTRLLDDAPLSEYHAKARRFQEFVDDIGSTIKGHDLKIPKRTNAVFSLRVGNLLTYPVLKATSFGVYLLNHLVFKAFSSMQNIFSNLLLGVAIVRHKFQYYMSLCKYIVTLAAKVRRMQDCLNDAEYVSHDDDDISISIWLHSLIDMYLLKVFNKLKRMHNVGLEGSFYELIEYLVCFLNDNTRKVIDFMMRPQWDFGYATCKSTHLISQDSHAR